MVSQQQIGAIMALLDSGLSQRTVSQRLNIPRSTIQKIIKRFEETGKHERRKGSGRKRKTTARDDRTIRLISLRNRFETASAIRNRVSQMGINVSTRTVIRRLHESNLSKYTIRLCDIQFLITW